MNTSKKLKILVLIAATFFALFALIACNGGGTSDGNPNSDGGSAPVESVEKPDDSKGGDTTADTASESNGTTESVGGGENVSTPDESTDSKDTETNKPNESIDENQEVVCNFVIWFGNSGKHGSATYSAGSKITLSEMAERNFDTSIVWVYYCNGRKTDGTYVIKNGDRIICMSPDIVVTEFTVTYNVFGKTGTKKYNAPIVYADLVKELTGEDFDKKNYSYTDEDCTIDEKVICSDYSFTAAERLNTLTIVKCDEDKETDIVYKFNSSTTLGEVVKAKFGASNIADCEYAFYTGEDAPTTNAGLEFTGGKIWAIKKSAIQSNYKITYNFSYLDSNDRSYKTLSLEYECNGVARYDTTDKELTFKEEYVQNGIPLGGLKKYVGNSEEGGLFLGDFGYYYKAVAVKVVQFVSVRYCIRSFNGINYDYGLPLSFEVEGEEMTRVYPITKIAEKINVNANDYVWRFDNATPITENFDVIGIDFGMFNAEMQTVELFEYFTMVSAEYSKSDGVNCRENVYKSGKQITIKDVADKFGVKADDYYWSYFTYDSDGQKTETEASEDSVINYNQQVLNFCIDGNGSYGDYLVYILCKSKKIEVQVEYYEENGTNESKKIEVGRGITVKELLKKLNYNITSGTSYMITFDPQNGNAEESFTCQNEESLNQKITVVGTLRIQLTA